MLGEISKVELDAARHTHQLFSRALIGDAIPHTLIYWAPEVLKLEKFSYPADMWSLGITLYQMATGEHPFNTFDEDEFRNDAFSANIDWMRLDFFP